MIKEYLSWLEISNLAILQISIFTPWGFISFLKTLFLVHSANFLACGSVSIHLFLQNGSYVGYFESNWVP